MRSIVLHQAPEIFRENLHAVGINQLEKELAMHFPKLAAHRTNFLDLFSLGVPPCAVLVVLYRSQLTEQKENLGNDDA